MSYRGAMDRILAIDYGRKRIGLAACDPLGIAAHPLQTLSGTPEQAIPAIGAICADRETTKLLVGMPYNMDGSEGPMAAEVRAFAARLAAATGLPLEFADERLTSYGAEEELRGLSKKQRRDRGRVDAIAAVTLLRDYLAARGK